MLKAATVLASHGKKTRHSMFLTRAIEFPSVHKEGLQADSRIGARTSKRYRVHVHVTSLPVLALAAQRQMQQNKRIHHNRPADTYS